MIIEPDTGVNVNQTFNDTAEGAFTLVLPCIINTVMGESENEGLETGIGSSVFILIYKENIAKNENEGFNPTLINSDLINAVIGENENKGFSFDIINDTDIILASLNTGKNRNEGFEAEVAIGEPEIILPEPGENQNVGSGTITLIENLMQQISYGDDIYLLVRDDFGKAKIYRGNIREKNPEGRILTITANLGDGILSERIVKEDFIKQDIGQVAKTIIEAYCSPLTAENVNTETGIEAPVPAKGKKAITVLENLRKQYNVFYFVSWEWDLHFYLREEVLEEGEYTVKLGDEY